MYLQITAMFEQILKCLGFIEIFFLNIRGLQREKIGRISDALGLAWYPGSSCYTSLIDSINLSHRV